MQYSMPSLMASGVSPFHQIGAGSDTSTVSWPALAGLAIGIDPFWPVNSQLPIMSAACADAPIPASIATTPLASNIRLNLSIDNILPGGS